MKGEMMKPTLQLALDFVDLSRAIKNAEAGIAGGVDWLEAGTPLIKSEGLEAVRQQPVDVVMLDIMLPDMSGLETFQRIHDLV